MEWLSHLKPNVVLAFAGIGGLLAFASIVVAALAFFNPKKNYDELKKRMVSWWLICGLLCIPLLMSHGTAFVLFAFLSFLALKEYFSIIPTRRADRRVLFLAYLAIPIQYYWVYSGWYQMFLIFIPVYIFLIVPLRMVTIGETRDFLRAASTLHWGVMMAVFSISHVAYLLRLPEEINPVGGGVGLVLFLLILTGLNDVAQFLWGKTLGRNKVIPKVSPGKTVEGLVGGIFTTTLIATFLAPCLTPITSGYAVFFGLLISVGGFVGDVIVSAIKRDIGVKDSGTILPGHGGILDRIDSLTYTSFLFFHGLNYFYY